MRRLVFTIMVIMLGVAKICAQDFSNKGNDFWIGYGNHVRMFGNSQAEAMQLYITSDVTTSGNVSIPSIGYNQAFTVTPGALITIDIPRSAALLDQGLYNHGIHVTSVKPIVVYSFIYVNAISGATLCLPTSTLGREYYSINYNQVSNENFSHSYFFVIATDTGTTTVEITPSQDTKLGQSAGVPFTVTLTQGQIYQVLGKLNTNTTGVDLTGSKIKSINNGSGCKRIAVYSGSGKISIGCFGAGSSDNLYQQMYPTSTWGKKYITVPGLINTTNIFRVVKSDPLAVVKINGTIISSASFVNNFYYEFSSNLVSVIESDKPIMVAQYFTTQSCSGNTGNSDPEMMFINPVEQTINNVTLNSMQPFSNTNINTHFLNVVIKNNPGAIGTFKIDGVPYSSFTSVPSDNNYAYAKIPTSRGSHNVSSDSGFNIIAYGFGNAESYGYSGGTNLRDLYQFLTIQNEGATVNFPSGCKGTPFKFSITFPYQPISIQWKFNGLFNDTTIINPVYDSTWVVNDRTLYRYKLNRTYILNNTGLYPIKIIADNPTPDGCSGRQEIDYELQIFEKPKADFNFTHSGCISDPVIFTDLTNSYGRTLIKWNWDFDDASSSALKNPQHVFGTAKTYNVKMSSVSDIGCLSDTATKPVTITNPPIALFNASVARCEKQAVVFTDQSGPPGTLAKWYWDFGDGATLVATNGNPVQHIYNTTGTYVVKLQVETISGCKSIAVPLSITVTPVPKVDFKLPDNVCLPSGAAAFTDLTTISDGSQSQLVHFWTFGDGGSSGLANPTHNYSAPGPYTVKLKVTSKDGCLDSSSKQLTNIFSPTAVLIEVTPEVCLGSVTNFQDKSTPATGAVITKWQWDFGDGTTAVVQNPTHTYAAAGNYIVTLIVTTDKGCVSLAGTKTTTVNALPLSDFTVTNPTCATKSIAFIDASLPNAGVVNKWNWSFGEGGVAVIQSPAYTYSNSGVYSVSLQVETDKGCKSAIQTKPVTVNVLPVAYFGVPEICLDDPNAQFTDSSRVSDNTQLPLTYAWNFDDPNATPGNPNTSTLKNPTHKYTAAGIYDIVLTVTTNSGCSKDTVLPFTVNGATPNADFIINNTGVICSNQSLAISDNSTVDFGNITKVEVYWDYLNDPTQKLTDDVPSKGKTYTHTYTNFGSPAFKDFQVRYVSYSGITCFHQKIQTVRVYASPLVQFAPLNAVCAEIAPFNIIASDSYNLPGNGVFTGSGVNAAGLFDPSIAKAGTHTLTYTYTANNGCIAADSQKITVFATPLVNAGPDRNLLQGGSIVLNATATGNGLTYQWSPPSFIDNNTILKPTVTTPDDITYLLTVVSSDNCTASDEVLVRVLKEVKVPNAFTPNGDGQFDTWKIEFLESYPGCTVEVYNRYGQPVYRSTGYDAKGWDGTMNGKPLPIGTYYWIINPKNGRKQMNGSVTIIR